MTEVYKITTGVKKEDRVEWLFLTHNNSRTQDHPFNLGRSRAAKITDFFPPHNA